MKCSQCGRRNKDDNDFCVVCAAPINRMPKSGRRFMPPQDLSDALSSRAFERPAPTRGSWGPAVVFLAVIALGVAVAYWAVYYVDIYQVEAIEHYL